MLSSGSSPGVPSVVGSAPWLTESGSDATRSASVSGCTAPANGTSRGSSERRSSALGSLGVVISTWYPTHGALTRRVPVRRRTWSRDTEPNLAASAEWHQQDADVGFVRQRLGRWQ